MAPNDWSTVWLAVGAVSVALMALLQVGAVIALLKTVGEAHKTLRGLQAQIAPLVERGQALLTNAGHVVHEAQGVASNLSVQVKRVEGAVTVVSQGVADLRHGVGQVTAQATGALAGARAFWSVIRRRRQDVDDLGAHD